MSQQPDFPADYNDAGEPPDGRFDDAQGYEESGPSGLCPQGMYRGRGVPGSAVWGKDSRGVTMTAVTVSLANGHQVTCSMSWAGKAETFTRQRLVALGWDLTDSDVLNGLGSKDVQVEVTHESYRNQRGEEKTVAKGQVVVNGFEFKNKMNQGEVSSFLRQQAAAAKALDRAPAPAGNQAPAQGGRRLNLR